MSNGGWRSRSTSGDRASTLPVLKQTYNSGLGVYKPREIGCISCDASGRSPNDRRHMRYLRADAQPVSVVEFDLMWGYHDRYIRMNWANSEGGLHLLLRWCLASGPQLRAATGGKWSASPASLPCSLPLDHPLSRPLNFDFVARRGHLVKVFVTPYSRFGWRMSVTLFRGTYFLLEEQEEDASSERAERNNYMGHKFEHYMTSETPSQAPDPDAVLDNNEFFFTVVTACLKNHSMLFSAEVDGKDLSYHEKEAPGCYVELKTTQVKGDRRNVHSSMKLKWWAQSFLAGIPRIIVGFKKDESTVEKCVMYDVTEAGLSQTAPEARENPDFWRPDVCMNFLNAFLSFVKKVVTEDNHEVVYTFSWNPREDVRYSVKRGPEHCFLLPEYIQCQRRDSPVRQAPPLACRGGTSR